MTRGAAPQAAYRVALAVDDAGAARDFERVLAARGIACQVAPLHRAVDIGADAIAFAPAESPTPATAALIAPVCRDAAEADRPVVVLAAFRDARGPAALHRAAALAYLRSSGAIVCGDPDVWIEVIALLAGHGTPPGARAAIVAAAGSWLHASAAGLEAEALALGARFPAMFGEPDAAGGASRHDGPVGDDRGDGDDRNGDGDGGGGGDPLDVALCDPWAQDGPLPDRAGGALVIPVIARAELLADPRFDEVSPRAGGPSVPLVGLRAALGAVIAAGQFAERRRGGLGAGSPDEADALRPDLERFERQIGKLGDRAGDHEAKVLLASWGIPVTRQAVAMTPSAAARTAKRAGYPVEIKPWGPDVASERDGCPVAREVTTAAEVRRAVAQVVADAGLPDGHPVIVRAAPDAGRDVSAEVVEIGALGWTVVLEVPGAASPAAAPAPLSRADADGLARTLLSSRADDPEPDHDALADILRRASHLAVRHADIVESVALHRVIVTARGGESMVVDAGVRLRRRG